MGKGEALDPVQLSVLFALTFFLLPLQWRVHYLR